MIVVLLVVAKSSKAVRKVGDYIVDEDDVEDNNYDRILKNRKFKCFYGQTCEREQIKADRGCREDRLLINRKCYKVLSHYTKPKVSNHH